MFVDFFLYLRGCGYQVTLMEWMTLMEGLKKGLHHSSFTGFYHLCRAILVKSEKDIDAFNQHFMAFFQDLEEERLDLTEELLSWLDKPQVFLSESELILLDEADEEERRRIREDLKDRLARQDSEHNRGRVWIGTDGFSHFGNRGHTASGIRVGGKGQHRRAFEVAGERIYRDFRHDRVLDTRQFQTAFRALRQYSSQTPAQEMEFDIDGTISETGKNAGKLKICYKPPRKNTVKLLLLMDSGGSMEYHTRLCTALFQAVTEANHFRDLKIYYFHNCLHSSVFTTPTMEESGRVPTEWLLNNLDSEYKVIFIGDALMDRDDLYARYINWRTKEETPSGMEWLNRFKGHFPHIVWLNPERVPPRNGYWGASYHQIAEVIDMFPLTVDGINQSMKKLLVNK